MSMPATNAAIAGDSPKKEKINTAIKIVSMVKRFNNSLPRFATLLKR